MKLYASTYRRKIVNLNDNYKYLSFRDISDGKIDMRYRTSSSINLFFSVLIGLPLLAVLSLVVVAVGTRGMIKEALTSESDSVKASVYSAVVVGVVFSFFVVGMDIAAIVKASNDNAFTGDSAKSEFDVLPLFKVLYVTLALDVLFTVVGLIFLVASGVGKILNVFFCCVLGFLFCKWKGGYSKQKNVSNEKSTVVREMQMWLLVSSLVAPVWCIGSHIAYGIIAWFSFPSTALSIVILYSISFVFYFLTLRQFYFLLTKSLFSSTYKITASEKVEEDLEDSSDTEEKDLSLSKGEMIPYHLGISLTMTSFCFVLGLFQVWLTLGVIGLPISNLIDSASLYLQTIGSTAFLTITGLLALNVFVVKPALSQDKIYEAALETCESIHKKKKEQRAGGGGGGGGGGGSGGTGGAAAQQAVAETKKTKLTVEEKLGMLLGAFLYKHGSEGDIFEEVFSSGSSGDQRLYTPPTHSPPPGTSQTTACPLTRPIQQGQPSAQLPPTFTPPQARDPKQSPHPAAVAISSSATQPLLGLGAGAIEMARVPDPSTKHDDLL